MNSELIKYSCIMALSVFINALSQVCLKKSAEKSYQTKWEEYFNPLVIGAYAIFFLSTFCAMVAYRVVPLSMGPIIESTGYIYITLFGKLLFNEQITQKRVVVLILTISGIVIYAVLGNQTV